MAGGDEAARLRRLLQREREQRQHLEDRLSHITRELGLAADELLLQVDTMVERDRLAQQMALAEHIQGAVLPPPLATPAFEVASAMDAADHVGGDFCDVRQVGDETWFAIGDVSGHGIDAGLIMLMSQAGFAVLTHALPGASPSGVLDRLNHMLHENVRVRMQRDDYVTILAARAGADGQVELAGGHDVDPIVVHADGTVHTHATTGMWLGMQPSLRPFPATRISLQAEDLLVFATDGLVDAAGPGGKPYGVERLTALVVQHRRERPGELVPRIRAAVAAWREHAPAEAAWRRDDATVMVARFVGTRTRAPA